MSLENREPKEPSRSIRPASAIIPIVGGVEAVAVTDHGYPFGTLSVTRYEVSSFICKCITSKDSEPAMNRWKFLGATGKRIWCLC